MKTVLQSIQNLGFNPQEITLNATLQHLHAGKKDHWSGGQIERFVPVLTSLRFVHTPSKVCVMEFSNANPIVVDDEGAYWSSLKLPEGVEPSDAKRLMTGMLSEYRTLSGKLDSAYEMVENDPKVIASILAQKEELSLDLMRLVNYIDLGRKFFDTMLDLESDAANATRKDLMFERFKLTAAFESSPCPRELFLDLMQERRAGAWDVIGPIDYYQWFRRSEKLFDDQGNITPDSQARFTQAVKAWVATGGEPTQEWLENKKYWARRNFEVHPRHYPIVDALVEKVALEFRAESPAALKPPAP